MIDNGVGASKASKRAGGQATTRARQIHDFSRHTVFPLFGIALGIKQNYHGINILYIHTYSIALETRGTGGAYLFPPSFFLCFFFVSRLLIWNYHTQICIFCEMVD